MSIVMPVKNGMQYLEASKHQLSCNASPCDQIVVVDDGSTDGSTDFLKFWASSDERVTYLRNRGVGIVSALNFGIRESAHQWIARFDVDDLYVEDRIDVQMRCIEPGDVAIFSDFNIISENQKPLGRVLAAVEPSAVAVSLINRQRIAHPSSIFNKQAALEVGGYREKDVFVEDLSLWLRLLKSGNLRTVPQALMQYRIHQNSISVMNRSRMINAGRAIIDSIGISSDYFEATKLNLAQIFSSYEKYQTPRDREFLLIRDLYTFSKYANLDMSGIRLELEHYSHFVQYPSSLIKLTFQSLRRRNYRKSFSNPKS